MPQEVLCGGVAVRSVGTVLGFQAWLEILTGIGMLTFAVASRGRSFARASGGRGLMAGLISVAGHLAYLGAVTVLLGSGRRTEGNKCDFWGCARCRGIPRRIRSLAHVGRLSRDRGDRRVGAVDGLNTMMGDEERGKP